MLHFKFNPEFSLSLSLSLFFFSGIILTLPDASFQPRVLSFFIFFFFLWYNIYNINSVRCFISTPSSLSLSLWYHNINSVRRFMTPEFSLCLSSSVGIIILTLSDASFEPRIEQFTRHTARSHKRRQTHSLTPGPWPLRRHPEPFNTRQNFHLPIHQLDESLPHHNTSNPGSTESRLQIRLPASVTLTRKGGTRNYLDGTLSTTPWKVAQGCR